MCGVIMSRDFKEEVLELLAQIYVEIYYRYSGNSKEQPEIDSEVLDSIKSNIYYFLIDWDQDWRLK